MAEIKNYTLNFSCGHSLCEFNFAGAKLAYSEVERFGRLQRSVFHG